MKILRSKDYIDLITKLEKMKCCGNCQHLFINCEHYVYCELDEIINFSSLPCDFWVLAE